MASSNPNPSRVDLPPTTVERGKHLVGTMDARGAPKDRRVQQRKFARRANSTRFYSEYEDSQAVRLPRKAPVPGYTGYFVGMNCDYGVSKAFGLPMELMQIPKTPQGFHEEMQNGLQSGYGPGGKHRMGKVSLFAGKGYRDKSKMMESLKRQRISGEGKPAPFDYVPGDGLVQECHIHTDSVFHQFPHHAAKVEYHVTTEDKHTHLIRRPKGSPMKGFAPPIPLEAGTPGTQKYSVFNLPTLREVQARKHQFTRV